MLHTLNLQLVFYEQMLNWLFGHHRPLRTLLARKHIKIIYLYLYVYIYIYIALCKSQIVSDINYQIYCS